MAQNTSKSLKELIGSFNDVIDLTKDLAKNVNEIQKSNQYYFHKANLFSKKLETNSKNNSKSKSIGI